jgi:hypothetical protein
MYSSSAERLAKIIIDFLCMIIYRVSGDLLPGGFVAEQKVETLPFGPTSSPQPVQIAACIASCFWGRIKIARSLYCVLPSSCSMREKRRPAR